MPFVLCDFSLPAFLKAHVATADCMEGFFQTFFEAFAQYYLECCRYGVFSNSSVLFPIVEGLWFLRHGFFPFAPGLDVYSIVAVQAEAFCERMLAAEFI